jgi:hypothetical protein
MNLSSLSARFGHGKGLLLVRRVHMYAGLVLLPWIFFFGLSGIFFNHPNIGADVRAQRVSHNELRERKLAPWEPKQAAEAVVSALSERSGQSYRLDGSLPELSGFTLLGAPAPQGRYMLLLDMERLGGVVVTRMPKPRAAHSSFPETQLTLPQLSTLHIENAVQGLIGQHGLPVLEELKAHPKIAPELRFQARDAQDVLWNLCFDTRTQVVSGRRADAFPNLGLAQILAAMHTTHHFPLRVGPLWFWALFEDLLGLTMMIWAVTGLVMWWQMKRTRLIGVLALSLALAAAGWVMLGTLNSLTFGDVKEQLGPG